MEHFEEILAKFEAAWKRGETPRIEAHLAEAGGLDLLVEFIHIDLDYRLKSGDTARVEDYLARFPDLQRESNAVAELAFAEFRLRDHLRRQPDPDELLGRFPEHREKLRKRLATLLEDKRQRREQRLLASTDPIGIHSGVVAKHLGPYKLLQLIGTGGMGSVYMAEQEKPIRRRVALKVIKPGMDSRQVLNRFDAEKQALAMMDHPNIARVLDAGITDGGQPYFAMELVKGVPITTYCDDNRLSLPERLSLFTQACSAIQHAHQKGIIHRDIKPSNVLVTLFDGVPTVKVIDFGLAKALQSTTRLTDGTLFTELGQVLGTFQYMSPEQAEVNALDIDTRSDVYSLGILLYELLTGSTPIERQRLKEMALDAVLLAIRSEDPPRPSFRLSSSADGGVVISEQRRVDPSRLVHILRGDLDWIVLRALEKDRTRRYESASAFAADVTRFLNNEAVMARPPSLSYRLLKTFRRHRVAVLTAAAFITLLIGASIVSTGLAVYARGKAKDANSAAELAIVAGQESRKYLAFAEAQRDDAVYHRNAAMKQGELLRQQLVLAEEQEMIIRRKKEELAVAVTLGFAVVESRYAGDQRPLLGVMRAVKTVSSEAITERNVEARAQVFRALGPVVELLSTDISKVSVLDVPRLFSLLKDAEHRLSDAISQDPELGLAYLARAELWSRALATVNSYNFFATAAGLSIPDASRVTQDWDTAIRLLPKSSLVYSGRGWWTYSFDESAALRDLHKAIELDNANDLALTKLGTHAYEHEEFRQALGYFMAAHESPAQVGTIFFSEWYQHSARVGVVNAAMAVSNRAQDRSEKLRTLAILNTVGEGVDEVEHIRDKVWSTIMEAIITAESPETLPADMAILATIEGPPKFHLTRLVLQGFADLAVGGDVAQSHLDEIHKLGAIAVFDVSRENVEKVSNSLLQTLPQERHAAITQFSNELAAIRFTDESE